MSATNVPITPSVLRWAIAESGYTLGDIAAVAEVPVERVDSWLAGRAQPTLGELRPVAAKLSRQLAVFLLPTPPKSRSPSVEFRRATNQGRKALDPQERLSLRESGRLQTVLSWATRELGLGGPLFQRFTTSQSPATAADIARDVLSVQVEKQVGQASPSAAFRLWRGALEDAGVFVLTFSMGQRSCRGFSIWDDSAPLVAINTSWNAESRLFTLLHELGHLVTRTNSACLDVVRRTVSKDDVERWCDSFAAALLLPETAMEEEAEKLGIPEGKASLSHASRIARRYKVSLRATVIRLIELDYASWSLYRAIPATVDVLRPSGGGSGRTRAEIRRDRFGDKALRAFDAAIQRDLLGRADAIDFLG